jgi:hypothetical protein
MPYLLNDGGGTVKIAGSTVELAPCTRCQRKTTVWPCHIAVNV